MLYPDTYNVVSKTLNIGELGSFVSLDPNNISLAPVSEYDPYAPVLSETYDGGTNLNGTPVLQPVNTIDGGTYLNGALVPPVGLTLNGGTY
jgi:hypothetical protein